MAESASTLTTMKKTLAALALGPLCFAASALDIKGIKVDQPADCEAITALETRPGKFAGACSNGRAEWYTQVSFLSGKTGLMIGQSPERIVTTVSAAGEFDFDEALDALTAKFGPPTSLKKTEIQNRMGATFEQVVATWVDGVERISISKHGSQIGTPFLLYSGKAALDEEKRRRAEKAQKAASNL